MNDMDGAGREGDPDEDAAPPVREWRRKRTVAVMLWASFLAACAETMCFFAYVDPVFLFSRDVPQFWLADRTASYSLGFFFFWVFTLLAAALAATLLGGAAEDPARRPGRT